MTPGTHDKLSRYTNRPQNHTEQEKRTAAVVILVHSSSAEKRRTSRTREQARAQMAANRAAFSGLLLYALYSLCASYCPPCAVQTPPRNYLLDIDISTPRLRVQHRSRDVLKRSRGGLPLVERATAKCQQMPLGRTLAMAAIVLEKSEAYYVIDLVIS